MTKQEARAKWPTKPIYWHGSNRCWNDQPLNSRSTAPPANTSDSVNKALALDLSAPRPKATKTEVFYPSIIVNNSVNTDLFIGAPLTGWPLLIDIDGQAPDPNNGADRCCWAINGCAEGVDRGGEMNPRRRVPRSRASHQQGFGVALS
jgi:hypothetical protein